MSRHYRQIVCLIFGFLLTSTLMADIDAEREALVRILHELTVIEPLITKAESHASKDTRIQFRYDWLRQDLKQIREGIQAHLDSPRATSRTFPPLRGDYRR